MIEKGIGLTVNLHWLTNPFLVYLIQHIAPEQATSAFPKDLDLTNKVVDSVHLFLIVLNGNHS